MREIKNILRNNYNCTTIVDGYSGGVCGRNDIIYALVSPPHDDINYWLVRFSTVVAFDRWANSTAVEEWFASKEEVIDYLEEKQSEIYRQLLEYLIYEYKDLENILDTTLGWDEK